MSFLVPITPFVEQQAVWELIVNPYNVGANVFPPMGPTPQNINYRPWATEIPTFRCPSDPGVGLPALGRTNYVACLGDSSHAARDGSIQVRVAAPSLPYPENSGMATAARAKNRGFFKPHDKSNFRDVLDGLSNTIAAGEIATDLGDRNIRTRAHATPTNNEVPLRDNPSYCQDTPGLIDASRPRFWAAGTPTVGATDGRGYRWADYLPNFGSCFTILAPNRELCANSATSSVAATFSSQHQGGAHALMGDGAVKFITDSIEAGNSRNPMVTTAGTAANNNVPGSQSPYGLWGALGTRAASETIDSSF